MPAKPTSRKRRDTPPPRTGVSEKDVLLGFLDYLRTSVAVKLDGDWSATFHPDPDESVADVVGAYHDAVAKANSVIVAATDLAAPLPGGRSVRWAFWRT